MLFSFRASKAGEVLEELEEFDVCSSFFPLVVVACDGGVAVMIEPARSQQFQFYKHLGLILSFQILNLICFAD